MAKTATAKTEEQENLNSGVNIPIPEGWEEEQTGFPPYWNPGDGKWFRGIVVLKDERDPDFIRFVLRATVNLDCQEGPADESAHVQVKVGEFFTCSNYAALPLERYMGYEVQVNTKKKRDLKSNKELWVFGLRCSPETRALVQARQDKLLQAATDAGL